MTKGDTAKAYFLQGYNCAQAVALAFAQEIQLDPALIARLASAFGGGLGRLREVCGALSGAAFVIAALEGNDDPQDVAAKAHTYARVQQLGLDFRAREGTYICRELLGEAMGTPLSPMPDARTDAYHQSRPCARLVHDMANALADALS